MNPKQRWFRDPERIVTLETEFKSPEGTSLLKLSITTRADSDSIGKIVPRNGESFPWMKRPVLNYPASTRKPHVDDIFGPANVQVTLKEIAEPSWFGKVLASWLGSQKSAIQDYAKDKLRQELDSGAKAKARLDAASAASDALGKYSTAYAAAKTARLAFEDSDTAMTRADLAVKVAVMRQHEALTREAFNQAGLPFDAYPAINPP